MNRAVFLDRDGVINRVEIRNGRSYPPPSLDAFEFLSGVAEAIDALKEAGFIVIVVTNQPDVATGVQRREVVEAMHERVQYELPVNGIKVCYHIDEDECACRKPKPGMLLEAAQEWSLDLSQSFLVCDLWRDIAAGRAAGCKTILIDYHYAEEQAEKPDAVVSSLLEASALILSNGEVNMPDLRQLRIKLFADGADLDAITQAAQNSLITGFTTNPTLMHKANVKDYKTFALEVLKAVPDRPVSFEVFSDDFREMQYQAREIASWGDNVYVKIPITNTLGEFSGPLIRQLTTAGVQVNVTAMMTLGQVERVLDSLSDDTQSILSVFAGRIADTGRDPIPIMVQAIKLLRPYPKAELLWASPRELLNIFQADAIGCHIITATNDILVKLSNVNKDLDTFSLETVRMFREDAVKAGYIIEISTETSQPTLQER